MELGLLFSISLGAIGALSAVTLIQHLRSNHKLTNLITQLGDPLHVAKLRTEVSLIRQGDEVPNELNDLMDESVQQQITKTREMVWQERFFRAGYFSAQDQKLFNMIRVASPIACATISAAILSTFVGGPIVWAGSLLGLIVGFQLPVSYLERVIQKRDYEVLYHLPLVIEQIVIGVSGSLDVGPCIQGVIKMADDRDSHNPVTELLRYVQHYIRTGVALQEALTEVGRLSCHTELKHSFMALAQVVQHGGEVTRQLQQLADSVTLQRETKVDAKIRKLELEATGPVGLVFVAFLGIILVGLGAQVSMVFAP